MAAWWVSVCYIIDKPFGRYIFDRKLGLTLSKATMSTPPQSGMCLEWRQKISLLSKGPFIYYVITVSDIFEPFPLFKHKYSTY